MLNYIVSIIECDDIIDNILSTLDKIILFLYQNVRFIICNIRRDYKHVFQLLNYKGSVNVKAAIYLNRCCLSSYYLYFDIIS